MAPPPNDYYTCCRGGKRQAPCSLSLLCRLSQHGVGLRLEIAQLPGPHFGHLGAAFLDPAPGARAAVLSLDRVAEPVMAHGQEVQVEGVADAVAVVQALLEDRDRLGELPAAIQGDAQGVFI